MKKLIKIALGAALPVVLAAGCSDYLKGGELTNNPNNPVQGSASNSQLFLSIETNNFVYQEGEMGRDIAQWTQQLIGVQRQQLGIYNYSGITNSTDDGEFQRPYGGGGLLDLRTLEASVTASGDLHYLGVAQVLEAWMIGTTADAWGDIPYSQAANYVAYPTPILDTQQDVYNAVEALLSQAITNLAGAGGGPGTADLVYGGSAAKWTALAHTLKARFYLHQAEKLGAAMYSSALTEAQLGIATPAGDYLAYHKNGLQLSSNTWWQFMDQNGGTGRAGDLVASNGPVNSTLWNMLQASGDPRFAEYFNATNAGGGAMNATRLSAGYHQPLVTSQENLLIIAEAQLAGAAAPAALTALNAEQTAWNSATAWHSAIVVPLSGSATLASIMTEKYITLFQNIETWNDWKRTCIPTLTPVSAISTFLLGVPSRMLYGASEQQTNPHIPPVGTAPNGARNWNDPAGC